MCSSRPCPDKPPRTEAPDPADRAGTAAGLAVVLLVLVALGNRMSRAPSAGDVVVFPDAVVEMDIVPLPATEAARVPEPPPELDLESAPEEEVPRVPVPEPEPVAEVAPAEESLPSPEVRPLLEETGDGGIRAEGVRMQWMAQLRRRIEENKFYPDAARSARETGTVTLRVRIGPSGIIEQVEIARNTATPLLVEGARAILRRVAATPLGTGQLDDGFEVEVPLTYRLSPR